MFKRPSTDQAPSLDLARASRAPSAMIAPTHTANATHFAQPMIAIMLAAPGGTAPAEALSPEPVILGVAT